MPIHQATCFYCGKEKTCPAGCDIEYKALLTKIAEAAIAERRNFPHGGGSVLLNLVDLAIKKENEASRP